MNYFGWEDILYLSPNSYLSPETNSTHPEYRPLPVECSNSRNKTSTSHSISSSARDSDSSYQHPFHHWNPLPHVDNSLTQSINTKVVVMPDNPAASVPQKSDSHS